MTVQKDPEIRHFIDIADHPKDLIRSLLETAKKRKANRLGLPKGAPDFGLSLQDYTLGMLFEKPSTRTRISFETGMMQLGGKCVVLQGDALQLGRGESIEDTARVMSRYLDAVMIRANDHKTLLSFAEAGTIPVINALTDLSHPCQLMADIMTIEEKRGPIAGQKVAWVGDANNVFKSLMESAVALSFDVVLACPEAYRACPLTDAEKDRLTVTDDPSEAVKDADVVMADTWVSMGDEDAAARLEAFAPYQVNDALMAGAKRDALFMHCLPAHRGEEVTDSVIDGPQSVVFDQAENRLHAQKAVLLWCLKGNNILLS